MGIKSLTKLLKDKAIDSFETKKLYQLKGKKLGIDVSIFIYQYLMNVRNNNKLLKNKEGDITSHISGIFYKTVNYLSLGIEPVYIFDGKPPEDKFELIKERNIKAEKARDKLKNSKDEKDILKYEKMSTRMNKKHIDDIKYLLNLMGVQYIQCEYGEAEAIASELCRIGYLDYVVTEDMDALVYGCPKMIRNNIDKTLKGKDIITVISLEQILESLSISKEKFIELCVLCGCDYCDNIPKIGIAKAFKIIKEYDDVEDFINKNKNVKVPENYLEKYKKAIKIFNNYEGLFDNLEDIPLHKSNIDISKLIDYLTNNCSMSELKVQNAIKKIQSSQSKISLPDGFSSSPDHFGSQ